MPVYHFQIYHSNTKVYSGRFSSCACRVALFYGLINCKARSFLLCFVSNHVLMCVQGVTYCGESSASSLTMANVPWHQEVVAFVQQLVDMLPQYEIACEHEHSNCLLIAHTKVRTQLQRVTHNLPYHFCSLHQLNIVSHEILAIAATEN